MRGDKIDPKLIKALLGEEEGTWDFLKSILATIFKYLFISLCVAVGVTVFTAIAYVFGFVLSFWGAFVCMHLWNWFLAPTFHLAPIQFFWMLGLITTFQALKGYTFEKEDETKENETTWEKLKAAGRPFLRYGLTYAFALLTGWIVHTYFI